MIFLIIHTVLLHVTSVSYFFFNVFFFVWLSKLKQHVTLRTNANMLLVLFILLGYVLSDTFLGHLHTFSLVLFFALMKCTLCASYGTLLRRETLLQEWLLFIVTSHVHLTRELQSELSHVVSTSKLITLGKQVVREIYCTLSDFYYYDKKKDLSEMTLCQIDNLQLA